VNKFIKDLMPYGTPDSPPKLLGRGINVMLTPLPRSKRAKNPNLETQADRESMDDAEASEDSDDDETPKNAPAKKKADVPRPSASNTGAAPQKSGDFANNPFSQLDGKLPS
jgi:translation initiation factor IF-3